MTTCSNLPVLDFSPFMVEEGCVVGSCPTDAQLAFAEQLDGVLKEHGFLYLDQLGLTSEELSTAFAAAKSLFEVRPGALAAYDLEKNIGHTAFRADVANHARPADLKESFSPRSHRVIENDLRGAPVGTAAALRALWERLEKAAFRFMRACSLALKLPPEDLDFFVRAHAEMFSTCMRLNHYPPCKFEPHVSDGHGGLGAIRIGEHTDFGLFTFLLLEGASPGLQVKKAALGAASDQCGSISGPSDGWVDAPGRGTSVIVNVGAAMARWTNDRWRATAHRVIVPDDGEASCHRYSIPFFVQPDPDAVIETHRSFLLKGEEPRYAAMSAKDHLQMKLAELLNVRQGSNGGS